MGKERMSDLQMAVINGAVDNMMDYAAKEEKIRQNEIQDGLRGEELTRRGIRSAETHTNGAREAHRAQQF